ncbi:hypothetical protein JBL43_02870 [Aureibaculum sp. A20]|uniref:Uncharacterized protein n=1 Tax=Aureibaculum flavum TaxID=2795986 RepID=A0ABS0WMH0_9FLAO|nr:hypothetical protein [Aureibaculum flavum]MBJ2173165.1 hypothetical protein [Aureibaculum flavum]
MQQFNLNNNTLTLKVQKSPLFVRSVMFLFSFLFFIAPVVGMGFAISFGGKFHIGYIFMMILFGLLGFYLLRISLWNTYGEEVIIFNKSTINYEANYGWFKDGKKLINSDNVKYSSRAIGYEEDEKSALIIENSDNKIESVVKIHNDELNELIQLLQLI